MRIVTQAVPMGWVGCLEEAVRTVDALVWGGRLEEHVDVLFVLADSDGLPHHPPIARGLADVYCRETRTATLHCLGLSPAGRPRQDSQLAWAVCHDLTHAFDVAHGNLRLDAADHSLTYMGRRYRLRQAAHSHVPNEYAAIFRDVRPDLGSANGQHRTGYYDAHNYWEPWEVRPLIMADACMAHIRSAQQPACPNLAA